MRAILVTSVGGPEVLQLTEVADPPPPTAGEVLVQVSAIGVDFADTERRRGIYSPPTLPWIPGREAAVSPRSGIPPLRLGTRKFFDADAIRAERLGLESRRRDLVLVDGCTEWEPRGLASAWPALRSLCDGVVRA